MRRIIICFLLLTVPFPALMRAAPEVSFADQAAGRAAILADPIYFDRMQPMEMEAKTGQPLMPPRWTANGPSVAAATRQPSANSLPPRRPPSASWSR